MTEMIESYTLGVPSKADNISHKEEVAESWTSKHKYSAVWTGIVTGGKTVTLQIPPEREEMSRKVEQEKEKARERRSNNILLLASDITFYS